MSVVLYSAPWQRTGLTNSGFYEDFLPAMGLSDLAKLFKSERSTGQYIFSPSGRHNVRTEEDAYVVTFLVPGLKRENLNIQVEGRDLTVSSTGVETTKEDKTAPDSSFELSSFTKTLTFGSNFETSDVTASVADGIPHSSSPIREALS